jgi:hypothetical protein
MGLGNSDWGKFMMVSRCFYPQMIRDCLGIESSSTQCFFGSSGCWVHPASSQTISWDVDAMEHHVIQHDIPSGKLT